MHPLDVEAPEGSHIAAGNGVQLGRLDEAVLAQLVAQEAKRQRRAVHRNVEARQYVRQRADVVLVTVRQHDAADARRTLEQPRDVGNDQVDTEHLLLGEHKPGVDDHDVVAARDGEHVAADLPETAKRNES